MGCELLAKGDDRVVGGAAGGRIEAGGCRDAAVAIGTAAALDGGVDLKADGGGVRQGTLLDQPGLLKALGGVVIGALRNETCLLYTSPSPRDATLSRMPSSA